MVFFFAFVLCMVVIIVIVMLFLCMIFVFVIVFIIVAVIIMVIFCMFFMIVVVMLVFVMIIMVFFGMFVVIMFIVIVFAVIMVIMRVAAFKLCMRFRHGTTRICWQGKEFKRFFEQLERGLNRRFVIIVMGRVLKADDIRTGRFQFQGDLVAVDGDVEFANTMHMRVELPVFLRQQRRCSQSGDGNRKTFHFEPPVNHVPVLL